MFKDYYNFKKKDKRIRWIYDRDSSEWKRETTPKYSEKYLNLYLFWWLLLVCSIFFLVLIFVNLPFTEHLNLKVFDSPLLFLDWFLYVLGMIIIAAFIKRFFRAFLFCFFLSTIAFFASDMLLLNYDTPLYFLCWSGLGGEFNLCLVCPVYPVFTKKRSEHRLEKHR